MENIMTNEDVKYYKIINQCNIDFKQYQQDGIKWCLLNEKSDNKIKGGFIADEMGLGKTITIISVIFINLLKKPSMIVVPPILLQQWYKEIVKILKINPLIYYGNNIKNITFNNINKERLILTTYNTLSQRNCKLQDILWGRIVFDEGHHMRNNNTKCFQVCNKLIADIRWIITGTPIQNKLKDFYNLCDIIKISPEFYKDNTKNNELNIRFILRRKKKDVGINIPPLTIIDKLVEWKHKNEKMLAEEIHSCVRCLGTAQYKCKTLGYNILQKCRLVSMVLARQMCVLPLLLKQPITDYVNLGLIQQEYIDYFTYSSKIDALIEFIVSRKNNQKGKVIFCNFRNEIDIIAERLRLNNIIDIKCYDGRNSGGLSLLNIANKVNILIIQIQTGCEGLNLQKHFSEIYFVSPHWNPSVESQSIARCHRIGQEHPVEVYRFIMNDFNTTPDNYNYSSSMDMYILEKQEDKNNIIAKLFD